MPLLMPLDGAKDVLAYLVNKQAPEDLVLRLFVNNIVPAKTDTAANYTEASGLGYAELTLVGADWTILDTDPPVAIGAQQVFTFTGALGNVYGYFLTRETSGKIAWAERFSDGPYSVARAGDDIKVIPRLELVLSES
jgi:hypothetical protein